MILSSLPTIIIILARWLDLDIGFAQRVLRRMLHLLLVQGRLRLRRRRGRKRRWSLMG